MLPTSILGQRDHEKRHRDVMVHGDTYWAVLSVVGVPTEMRAIRLVKSGYCGESPR